MPSYLLITFLAAGFLAVVAYSVSYYEYRGIGPQEGILRRGDETNGKKAVITFDDGPSAEYTPQILDILRRENVKAAFFLTGKLAEANPEIVRRILREGHELGNHTYSHANLVFLKDGDWQEEIVRGEEVIEKITGQKPIFFRPPRCLLNNKMRLFLLNRGYRVVLWSVSAADWLPLSRGLLVGRIRRFTKPGSILLFHDGGALVRNQGGKRDATVKALASVIKALRDDGYVFTTIGDLNNKIKAQSVLS